MQKMVEFYPNKGLDMLKLGYILPNLANLFLHSSTSAKIYPFTESDNDSFLIFQEDMVGGPSIVFTQKTVIDNIHIRKSTSVCKSIAGRLASQLYTYPICQLMPTGLYTIYEFDTNSQRFKTRHNESRSFEKMVMSEFQQMTSDCRTESFYSTATQKKLNVSMPMGSVHTAKKCLKHWIVFIIIEIVKKYDLP